MNDPDDPNAQLRRVIYALLMVAASGTIVGRIWCVSSSSGKTPFLSANDRSRWSTIRALVDHGTYSIDAVVLDARGRFVKDWQTIDMVRHRGPDGQEHYYSSKPPLFPTLLAGPYWLIRQTTGATLAGETMYLGRVILIVANVLPLVGMFLILARLVERYGHTDGGRVLVMTTATLGTFLTTFAVTLNNHLPAAVSVLIAVDAAIRILVENDRRWRWFLIAGFFAAFSVANELPALAFAVMLVAGLLWTAPQKTFVAFIPAAALVAAAFWGTNWIAHQSLRPPYAHRSDGAVLTQLDPVLMSELDAGAAPQKLRQAAQAAGIELSEQTTVETRSPGARWVVWDPVGHDRLAIVAEGDVLNLRAWDNWYDYEKSYWTSGRATGVDRGEPSIAIYAFHVLVGHHGVFSLTPVWMLSVVGAILLLMRRESKLRGVARMTVLLTVVVLAFYISRPLIDRNYGGVTNGLRWSFWLIPLWLLVMIPAADAAFKRRRWLIITLVLIFISIASVNYKPLNPWSHPWLFDYWTYLGWIAY